MGWVRSRGALKGASKGVQASHNTERNASASEKAVSCVAVSLKVRMEVNTCAHGCVKWMLLHVRQLLTVCLFCVHLCDCVCHVAWKRACLSSRGGLFSWFFQRKGLCVPLPLQVCLDGLSECKGLQVTLAGNPSANRMLTDWSWCSAGLRQFTLCSHELS